MREEQEFEVLVVSHWLQAVVSVLFLGQGGIFHLFLKSRKLNSHVINVLPYQNNSSFFLLFIQAVTNGRWVRCSSLRAYQVHFK